jgi:hypothetical protein
MNMRNVAAAAALATLGSSAFAQAYVGVGLGRTHACVTQGVVGTCADDATTVKALAGYEFAGTGLAVEGIFTHLGSFKGDTALGTANVRVDTFGAGGAWRPQFGAGWGGVLRAGIEYGRTRERDNQVVLGSPVPIPTTTHDQDYWQPYAGAGVTYAIAPKVRLEAGVDFTRVKVFRTPTGATSWMLGATFGF